MIKEVIGVGIDIMEALADAKNQLGLDDASEVEYEVIQRAQKKVLGIFGGSPAKVKIIMKASPADTAEEFITSVLKAMKLENITVTAYFPCTYRFNESFWLFYIQAHLPPGSFPGKDPRTVL